MDDLYTDTRSPIPLLIAGERRHGCGDLFESHYPATGEVIARLHAPSRSDVDEAICAADHAFNTSGWAQRKPHERAAVLHRIATRAIFCRGARIKSQFSVK